MCLLRYASNHLESKLCLLLHCTTKWPITHASKKSLPADFNSVTNGMKCNDCLDKKWSTLNNWKLYGMLWKMVAIISGVCILEKTVLNLQNHWYGPLFLNVSSTSSSLAAGFSALAPSHFPGVSLRGSTSQHVRNASFQSLLLALQTSKCRSVQQWPEKVAEMSHTSFVRQ